MFAIHMNVLMLNTLAYSHTHTHMQRCVSNFMPFVHSYVGQQHSLNYYYRINISLCNAYSYYMGTDCKENDKKLSKKDEKCRTHAKVTRGRVYIVVATYAY